MSVSIAYRRGMDYSDLKIRSRRGDSNSRPAVYETAALPLSYVGRPVVSLPGAKLAPTHPARSVDWCAPPLYRVSSPALTPMAFVAAVPDSFPLSGKSDSSPLQATPDKLPGDAMVPLEVDVGALCSHSCGCFGRVRAAPGPGQRP